MAAPNKAQFCLFNMVFYALKYLFNILVSNSAFWAINASLHT